LEGISPNPYAGSMETAMAELIAQSAEKLLDDSA
jgi:hypothetical protein